MNDRELLIRLLKLANKALYRYNAMINRHEVPDYYGVGETFGKINEYLDELPDDLIDQMETD